MRVRRELEVYRKRGERKALEAGALGTGVILLCHALLARD